MRIMVIKRLITAVDGMGMNTSVMEQQIQRSKERLNMGVDLNGGTFAPYKDDRPSNQNRPLAQAARLWDDVRYSSSRTLEGFELTATITGEAAKIAIYQNVKRRFVGYSSGDRDLAKQGVSTMLREAMKRGIR